MLHGVMRRSSWRPGRGSLHRPAPRDISNASAAVRRPSAAKLRAVLGAVQGSSLRSHPRAYPRVAFGPCRRLHAARRKAIASSPSLYSRNTSFGMQTNTFGLVVHEWVRRSFRSKPRFTTKFKKNGEFEAFVRAPRGSEAGALVIFTFQGDLWVRFDPPHMCYGVDSRAEMTSAVRQLLSDKSVFVTTYRRNEWTGTTLLRPGTSPRLRQGETGRMISWSGRFDALLGDAQSRRHSERKRAKTRQATATRRSRGVVR